MERMVKPQEVLISVDAEGEVVDDEEEDHEKLSLYEAMKVVLIYVTNIDASSMDEALNKQLDWITRQPRDQFPYDKLS